MTRTSKAEQEILPPVSEPTDEDVEKQTAALVHYTAMCWEIQHCARVDEAKDIRDKAMALAVYAKQAQNHEAEKLAAKIRLRAEIRAGELLKTTERAKPGQAGGGGTDGKGVRPSVAPTLSDFGVTKEQSSQWQQLANIPESAREAYIAEPDQIPSASGLLAKHAAAKTIEAEPVVTGELASARKTKVLPAEQEKIWSSLYPKVELSESEARRYEARADEIAGSEPIEVLFALVAQLGFCDPLCSGEYKSWARDWIEAQEDDETEQGSSHAVSKRAVPAPVPAASGKRRGDAAS